MGPHKQFSEAQLLDAIINLSKNYLPLLNKRKI